MVDGGFCRATCGRCTPEASEAPEAPPTAPPAAEPASPPASSTITSGQTSKECTDVQPPGNYTCAQQKAFGACNRGWMINGNYCQQTCGRCGTTSPTTGPTSEQVQPEQRIAAAAAAAQTPAKAPATEAPNPESERQRADLAAAAAELARKTAGNVAGAPPAVALPALNLGTLAANPTAVTAPPTSEPVAPPAIELPPLPPPAQEQAVQCNTTTAWSALSSDPDLSTTQQAAQILNLQNVLQDSNVKFTLFAPRNAAWTSAATASGQTLQQFLSSRNVLQDIFFSHVIPNSILDAKALRAVRAVRPQTGVPIFVSAPPASGQSTITLVSTGSNSQVIGPDEAVGCNYVINKVDTLLRSSPGPEGINAAYTRALAAGGA